jgi:hypothetical protein
MSVRTMARVWEHSQHSGSELLMLLAIADFADDEGRAYPSVDKLAQKCRMSSRNANFILSTLRGTGELEVRRNEGPRGTNLYRIAAGVKPVSPLKPASSPEAEFTPEEGFTLKPASVAPEAGFPKPLKPASPEPSMNHQEPPESSADKPRRLPRSRRPDITLKTYLQQCREEGTKPVPDTHPVRAYCRDAGIADEMLQVAWCVFREDYTTGTSKDKRYRDWPGHFHNAVRGCWAKLWFTDAGEVKWTSRGLQEKTVLETRMKAKEEAAHAPA